MSAPEIDYNAVFQLVPSSLALLTPDFIIIDVNREYVRLAGRSREELVGRYIFDVFPENPNDPDTSGIRSLRASFERALESRDADSMGLFRFDLPNVGRPGAFEERWWSPVNVPILAPDGSVQLFLHRAVEVTDIIRQRGVGGDPRLRVMEADLMARTEELHELNERLRRAHAREREVALALQEAMLQAPGPVSLGAAAVRYRPAASGLNVCGDWYDLVELPGERLAVAVGDVVGHGLAAAGVMGQLRSALSAAVRFAVGPARALQVLGRYAESVKGAQSTTVVQVMIDWPTRYISYSCAGHPPPALLRGSGTVEFLDRATDPPLGILHIDEPGSEASVSFDHGDTLVLYTDGLVERRGESIDAGISRLASNLVHGRDLLPEALADALLSAMSVAGEPTDDTALVVIRLLALLSGSPPGRWTAFRLAQTARSRPSQ